HYPPDCAAGRSVVGRGKQGWSNSTSAFPQNLHTNKPPSQIRQLSTSQFSWTVRSCLGGVAGSCAGVWFTGATQSQSPKCPIAGIGSRKSSTNSKNHANLSSE